ncbi:MAG TPA: hypothetical protein VIU87_25110 [Mycobacterium sp.]
MSRKQYGRPLPLPGAGAKRAAAVALATLCLLTGCARTTAGQVAMTTEPLSPDLTCGEFITLGDGDRIKVVNEILAKQGGQSSDSQAFLLSALAGILCKGTPEAPLKDILVRMKVR